jgi:hypothetical protein
MVSMDLETASGKLTLLDPEMGRLVERLGRPDPFSFSPILSRVGEDHFRAMMLQIIGRSGMVDLRPRHRGARQHAGPGIRSWCWDPIACARSASRTPRRSWSPT